MKILFTSHPTLILSSSEYGTLETLYPVFFYTMIRFLSPEDMMAQVFTYVRDNTGKTSLASVCCLETLSCYVVQAVPKFKAGLEGDGEREYENSE